MKRFWIITFLLMGLFSVVPNTSAHGYLVRAIPENRAVLDRAPTRVQYWFSEGLETQFSTINIRDQAGAIIASGGVSETDNTLLTARLPNDLPNGAYVVELRPAFSSDGHVYGESRVFFIGEAIGNIDLTANVNAIPLEIVWRVLTVGASLILFGTLALYNWVLIPAWRNPTHKAGFLPPRLMNRLHALLGFCLLIGFIGNSLALIQQTMVFFNIPFVQALQPQFWELVRVGSRFGDVWMWRMVIMSLLGMIFLATLAYQNQYPDIVYPFWAAGLWLGALILGTFSITSHAAGALTIAWAGIFVDWGHRIGVAIWVGGLFALIISLPIALTPYTDDQRLSALRVVVNRFSGVAVGALAVVIASGIYSASNWIYGGDELNSSFGASLITKLILIAPLLAIGGVNHLIAHPDQFARLRRWINPQLRQFMSITRIEILFAGIVVVTASTLSATPIPKPAFIQTDAQAPSASQTVEGMTIYMNITPGGIGVNTFDIRLSDGDIPITDAQVQVMNQSPSQDKRGDIHLAEPIDGGVYVSAGAEIDREGEWWSVVHIIQNEITYRAVFVWDISADAGVIISLPPTPIQLGALGLVFGAVTAAFTPTIRKRLKKMGLNTFTVSFAVAATIITIFALVVGWIILGNSQQEYFARLNPPPVVINTSLPTGYSIQRGEALFSENCATWSDKRDFDALLERLERTRDEELYDALLDGWRDLPTCARELPIDARWDMVNYLRGLQFVEQ